MKRRKLTLLGFMIALAVGLSLALSQAVTLAQETTASTPAAQETTTASKKGTHKGKKHMKDMKKKNIKPASNEVKPDMAAPQAVK